MTTGVDLASLDGRTDAEPTRLRYAGFGRYAWAVLLYTLFVIAFGAWVRITGSGAGCGSHWPTCHGEVVPRSSELETWIEYTHRVTSALLGPMALALCGWAWFGAGRRRAVRIAASVSLLFVLIEGLIGAGLVKGELVADDASSARAFVVALHLGNTLTLTAASGLTAWLGAGRPFRGSFRGEMRFVVAALGLLVVVSMTGAVTALGDTLFPVATQHGDGVWAALREGASSGAHFLVKLRVVHPLLAVAVALVLATRAFRWMTRADRSSEPFLWARQVHALAWAQLFCGALNISLGAPGWMQLVHLLLAQWLWIATVLLFASGLSTDHAANQRMAAAPVDR